MVILKQKKQNRSPLYRIELDEKNELFSLRPIDFECPGPFTLSFYACEGITGFTDGKDLLLVGMRFWTARPPPDRELVFFRFDRKDRFLRLESSEELWKMGIFPISSRTLEMDPSKRVTWSGWFHNFPFTSVCFGSYGSWMLFHQIPCCPNSPPLTLDSEGVFRVFAFKDLKKGIRESVASPGAGVCFYNYRYVIPMDKIRKHIGL